MAVVTSTRVNTALTSSSSGSSSNSEDEPDVSSEEDEELSKEDEWLDSVTRSDVPMSNVLHALPDTELFYTFQRLVQWLLVERCGFSTQVADLMFLHRITYVVNNAWHHIHNTPARYNRSIRHLLYPKFYHVVIVMQNMAKRDGLEIQPSENSSYYIAIEPEPLIARYFPDDKSLRDILDPVSIEVTHNSVYETGKIQLKRNRPVAKNAAQRAKERNEPTLNPRKLRVARQVFHTCMSDYVRIIHLQELSRTD